MRLNPLNPLNKLPALNSLAKPLTILKRETRQIMFNIQSEQQTTRETYLITTPLIEILNTLKIDIDQHRFVLNGKLLEQTQLLSSLAVLKINNNNTLFCIAKMKQPGKIEHSAPNTQQSNAQFLKIQQQLQLKNEYKIGLGVIMKEYEGTIFLLNLEDFSEMDDEVSVF
ncbi:Ubiquitin-like_domain superfamily [Hexamita inflata]|uniref:Ubiquitin-like domain superfamily n=1 Tax=Hexamita inflata TaxID=28002 RepID=A0AA86PZ56_9EUKA|nr:Ubiquitin-like domain superfamily [Hexamita inflata]CAI9946835.1 Ubiquitin-like domain superfamily [Hexamita inflata]